MLTATSAFAGTVKAAASLTAVAPTATTVDEEPPNVTVRSVLALTLEPEVRWAMWTLRTFRGVLPKTFEIWTLALVPPMLVCTIWRSVFWLKVVPLLCGDALQVPVQPSAATPAGGGALAMADGTAAVTVAAPSKAPKTKARKENDMLIAVLTIAG
jgi:hypothetical protein